MRNDEATKRSGTGGAIVQVEIIQNQVNVSKKLSFIDYSTQNLVPASKSKVFVHL
jgi:hypothetical protein